MHENEEYEKLRRIEIERIDKRRVKRIKDEDFYETLEEVFD